MAPDSDLDNLRSTLSALETHGVLPLVATALEPRREAFSRELVAAVTGEVPAYQASANPELIPELEAHLAEVVVEVCGLLSGKRIGHFEFVAEHARRRAAQKFPLDAVLHAYRCVHRQLSRWVRDAALETADESAQIRRVVAVVTDFTVEYTGALGSVLTSEYVAHTRVLAEAKAIGALGSWTPCLVATTNPTRSPRSS